MEFSFLEKTIFLILVIIAVGVFVFLARKPFKIIVKGKPDTDRKTGIGLRLSRVISEVLFQTRVIGGRPVVGIFHALVFAAFLFFSLETTNMFLEPYGLAYLPSLFGDALPIFRAIVMILATLCALSMVALTFRRFVMINISPNPKSYESALVALFIVILMQTYIDMFGIHAINPKINWWVHAVIILAFPAVILNSKHRHIFLAPFAVFLRKQRLWDVEKMDLNFEEAESEEDIQLGLESLADIPWKLRFDFFSCVECKRCTDNCPAAQAGQELRPSEFIIAGRKALLSGKPEDAVVGNIISEKALGQCTTCMACENICPVGVEHSQLLSGAKAMQTMAVGTGPATEFLKTMTNYSNPFSAGQDVRNNLIEELQIPFFDKDSTEYLLWLGCIWSYNPDFKKMVEATIKLFKAADVSYGVLQEEICCGHHSRKQGEEMQFQMLAEENAVLLKNAGVKKIVTGCPHCLNTIRHDYKDYFNGFAVELMHHSQLLNDLMQTGKLQLMKKSNNGITTTYHDPCYLGRYEHVFDDPRKIIRSAGYSFVETNPNGKYSYCCGGGAAGFTIESKDEKRVDQVRKEQIKKTGADVLITSCPECNMMLQGTVETTKDISELMADLLGQ